MIEIKFRGKRIDNGEWVEGYFFKIDPSNECFIYNGYSSNPFDDAIIPETIGQYVEILDAYEGDLLYGCETDEYNSICESWVGEVKFNKDKGRLMVFDKDVDEWFEVDDFMFDKIIGNIYGVK